MKITLDEYIEIAKGELDDMAKLFADGHEKNPEMWPLENGAGEWIDQELASRFS